MTTEVTTFKDKRNREWEMFMDRSYYDCTCVRPADKAVFGSDFNSHMSFHFATSAIAAEFVELLKQAS